MGTYRYESTATTMEMTVRVTMYSSYEMSRAVSPPPLAAVILCSSMARLPIRPTVISDGPDVAPRGPGAMLARGDRLCLHPVRMTPEPSDWVTVR